MKFCVNCGKKTEELEEGLCSNCSNKQHLIKLKDISTKICLRCKKYTFQNKWLEANDLDEALKCIIKKSFKEKIEVKTKIPQHYTKPGIEFEATAIITSHNNEYHIPIQILFTSCEKCSKEGTKYFEGRLQLRTTNKDVLSFVEQQLKRAEDKGIFVAKIEQHKNGLDYYITSKAYIKKISKELKKRFKGEVKETAKLFSRNRQTSKDIYRTTTLFKSEELLD
jgi:NMD protein affecting ribosome stability and mRNA decay